MGALDKYGAYTDWSPLDKANSDRIAGWTGIAAIPEPASSLILGVGVAMFLVRRRKSVRSS